MNKNQMMKKMNSIAKNSSHERSEIKKTGTFHGKSNELGGGGRFAQMVEKVGSPALAAYIGRKTLGKEKFQKLAAKGRRRASKS